MWAFSYDIHAVSPGPMLVQRSCTSAALQLHKCCIAAALFAIPENFAHSLDGQQYC